MVVGKKIIILDTMVAVQVHGVITWRDPDAVHDRAVVFKYATTERKTSTKTNIALSFWDETPPPPYSDNFHIKSQDQIAVGEITHASLVDRSFNAVCIPSATGTITIQSLLKPKEHAIA